MFLLTRPLPKLNTSTQAFLDAGINVTGVATSDIHYHEHACEQVIERLLSRPVDAIIVTSVYAVPACIKSLKTTNKAPTVFAVGTTTAALLNEAFPSLRVLTPSQHTSEGILAMHQVNEANCKEVVIIKGEGGRNTLQYTLEKNGKTVTPFCVYKRKQLATPVYTKNWKLEDVSGIIATSENMAMQLIASHSTHILTLPWVTVSERIARTLKNYNVANVAVCERATDQALIAWVKDNWEY
ncbi:uroporphyrinogen-III synthase [Alteromonas sp. 345S023]|uniref:Uroporphyrinogen-III synthase n=1 Tax=Alteromonas profundi TaxID=2696062 RepID=A0A7X5LJH4_9ALTE|nr:uroporphyrinogen-III synthase [Alteromonas profundi]NDV90448.1 uroporphyrinogen-III synthase [Alteromonas profundi]